MDRPNGSIMTGVTSLGMIVLASVHWAAGSRVATKFTVQDGQTDDARIDQNLADMLEIDCYPIVNYRLHLTETPFGLLGMTDEMTRLNRGIMWHGIGTSDSKQGSGSLAPIAALNNRQSELRYGSEDRSAAGEHVMGPKSNTGPLGTGQENGTGSAGSLAQHTSRITQLADTLCARLCHDLSGPLGTVAGAVEMAIEDPAAATEPLSLAQDAAGQMIARLRLMRAAWTGDCGALDAATLAGLAVGLSPRVSVDLDRLAGQFPSAQARILVNLLLLAMDALPRGGTISLAGTAGGDVMLMATGVHAAWPPGLPLALADPAAADWNDPRNVQAPLTAHLAREAGLRLALLFAPGSGTGLAPLLLTAA